jgi:predicted metal-dependent HD superfamily phosphohydrolase
MSVTLAAWQEAWRGLGAEGSGGLFNQLVAAYSEPHRSYHTLRHLRECLGHLQDVRPLAQRPDEIALALWFHDAVYDPQRTDNEARSADWARASVLQAGLPEALADRIHALVLATREHQAAPDDGDAQLLLDIDLAILGAPQARYDEFEQQVRSEYAHVPQAEFRTRRAALLRGFLARPSLYATQAFRGALELRARVNLGRAVVQLQAPAAASLATDARPH